MRGQTDGSDGGGNANDRFKRSFGTWFWGSLILATIIHFSAFYFFPNLEAADFTYEADEAEIIDLPPEITIPPPPQAIARPATPVMVSAEIDEDITIAPTTFENNPVEALPPPPTEDVVSTDISAAPTFTPFTVKPDILNRDELERAMKREYPPLLRDAGIGGTVIVHFFIDENGVVQNSLIAGSSGHTVLDEASLKIAPIIRFSPALNRDRRVPVWIQIPIVWKAK